MKRKVLIISSIFLLIIMLFAFSGCKLQIETTDNSVSASVDGDTTEKVDNIIDWIKERLSRLFNTGDSSHKNDSAEQI